MKILNKLSFFRIYANNHKVMKTGKNCGDSFPGGITNGAEWYGKNYLKYACIQSDLKAMVEEPFYEVNLGGFTIAYYRHRVYI